MMTQEVIESKILRGKELASRLRQDQEQKIKVSKKPPSLLVFADLSHGPSKIYVGRKVDYCRSLGLQAEVIDLSVTSAFEARIILRSSESMVLVQLPVPKDHWDLDKIIPENRDIEGFNPNHLGNLMSGNWPVYPCTAKAIMSLLDWHRFEFEGARVCIINDSLVVGKPLAMAMSCRNATPIICNKYTRDLSEITRMSDLIVTAVGKPNFSLNSDMIKKGVWVVDVGCKVSEEGKVIGDLETEARIKCAAYTPSVGGVGPVTVAQVVSNMLKLNG